MFSSNILSKGRTKCLYFLSKTSIPKVNNTLQRFHHLTCTPPCANIGARSTTALSSRGQNEGHKGTYLQHTSKRDLFTPPLIPNKSSHARFSNCRFIHHGCSFGQSSKTSYSNNDPILSDVTVSRWMMPDDANMLGVVHGGVILQIIEEAGGILATKYCNAPAHRELPGYEPSITGLVRVEQTDFRKPLRVGSLVQTHADILYTSPHSIQVQVSVWSEDILKGEKHLTNQAVLWYVPVSFKNPQRVTPVPPMKYSNPSLQEAGVRAYKAQQRDRHCALVNGGPVDPCLELDPEAHTVAYSQSTMSQMVHPSQCAPHGYCKGGVTMHWMDECAGLVAARHCGTIAVTASMAATNFHQKVKLGSVVTLTGRPVFTSSKSLEVQVLVDCQHMLDSGCSEKFRAVEAFFTFVAIGKDKKILPIPQLKLRSADEERWFKRSSQKYDAKREEKKLT